MFLTESHIIVLPFFNVLTTLCMIQCCRLFIKSTSKIGHAYSNVRKTGIKLWRKHFVYVVDVSRALRHIFAQTEGKMKLMLSFDSTPKLILEHIYRSCLQVNFHESNADYFTSTFHLSGQS